MTTENETEASDESRSIDGLVRHRDYVQWAKAEYANAVKAAFPIGETVETKYCGQPMTAKITGYPRNVDDGWLKVVSDKGVKEVSVHEEVTKLVSFA